MDRGFRAESLNTAGLVAGSPRIETGQQQSREVATLAAVAHQLVQDVGEDQNSYQQAFGPKSICLPAVTCRQDPYNDDNNINNNDNNNHDDSNNHNHKTIIIMMMMMMLVIKTRASQG